jgi:two-component system copper resistance phosphate regulon response regulator CusR
MSRATAGSRRLFRKTSVARLPRLRYNVFTVTSILVVEDESKVARAVQDGLKAEGYDVALASTGDEGLLAARTRSFDLVVLDLMLPGRDGLETLSALRGAGDATPVLILTARDTVLDRVAGLDAGADDYLVKPFAFAELLARVRALLRRGRPDVSAGLSVGDLEIDPVARRATRAGQLLALTAREFTLLEYLVRHQDQVVSREQIAREVWREPSRGTPLDNVIDVHIMRLRRKVDPEGGTRLIHTVRGVGFVVREDEP